LSNDPFREQLKKFAIKSMYGFQTVCAYSLGIKAGFFRYLEEKAKNSSESGKINSVSFTFDELIKELKVQPSYLESWLQLATECGIFEIENMEEKRLITAPHVYDILIDRKGQFFIGNMMVMFYNVANFEKEILNGFKTGKWGSFADLPGDTYKMGQKVSATMGITTEKIFSKVYKDYRKVLRNEGSILEVGCGYGFNLKIWAKKYKKAKIIGIDIDPKGIESAKKIITKNNWDERIQVFLKPIKEFASSNQEKFDIILLNHVLHEMVSDQEYRIDALNDMYTLLKDDGLLIVGENMIPNLFEPKKGFMLFEVMHKWMEVGFDTHFYNEDSFQELIKLTKFNKAELVRDRNEYFWALTK